MCPEKNGRSQRKMGPSTLHNSPIALHKPSDDDGQLCSDTNFALHTMHVSISFLAVTMQQQRDVADQRCFQMEPIP